MTVADEAKVEKIDEKDSFFGGVDRSPRINPDGTFRNDIGSAYPAYMLSPARTKLEDSIRDRESALESGFVPAGDIEYYKRTLAMEKSKLAKIDEGIPELTPELERKMKAEIDHLNAEVSDSMFVRKDMEKGIADPHIEAHRMKNPCVKVDRELAAKCNVAVNSKGQASRDDATRMWKILKWIYTHGEGNINPETLRRDFGGSLRKASQVTVDIDLKELERKRIEAEKAVNELEIKKAKLEYELKDKIKPEEIKMWTCPDCSKEMNIKGRPLHLARWCSAKKEEEVLVGDSAGKTEYIQQDTSG